MPIKALTPHIRAGSSIPRMMWTVNFSFLPALIVFHFVFGFSAFRTFVVMTTSAGLSEMAVRKIFGKSPTLYDGSAILSAILLTLIVPPTLPSWLVALASFFAIVFGKEIFGGLGQNPFNSALVGRAFLQVGFPSLMGTGISGEIGALSWAVLLGGGLVVSTRLIRWEIPLVYLIGYSIFFIVWERNLPQPFVSYGILLAAFFLVTDPVTTPISRSGNRWFAFGSGLLTALARPWIPLDLDRLTYGILILNGLTPWLDQWSRRRS